MAIKTTRGQRKSKALKDGVSAGEGNGFEMAALLQYLVNEAVSELWITEFAKGSYRLEALLTWKPGRCTLVAARGGQRTFRSVDTVVRFLREIGVGKTLIRLELKT